VSARTLAAALALLLCAGRARAQAPAPRSVILLLADGLSWGQLQLLHDELAREKLPSALEDVLAAGHTAYCETAPLGALVVESGAGSSAVATGVKIANRSLSELPDGTRPPTILDLARRAGMATGLISTGRLTHAGPAAFLAHQKERDNEYAIARAIVETGTDVLLGGGRNRFTPSALGRAEAAGYAVLLDSRQLDADLPAEKKLLGLFADDGFPYSIDRDAGRAAPVPDLARLEALALERLSRAPKGFVLVVNSRLVDEAAHYHDAAAMLGELRATDRAARVALDFVRAHPDTLLLVTTNHDTAGYGMEYRANPARWGGDGELARIAGQKASYLSLLSEVHARERAGETLDAALIRGVVAPRLAEGVALNDADWAAVAAALSVGPKRRPFEYSPATHALAAALEPYYLASWNTGTHLSNPVPCFGLGPGSESLRGLLQNTALFGMMKAAADRAAATSSPARARP
jgi:alkaline phosphatase